MATRKEITWTRSLEFSQWIRKNLPDSQTGYMVSDIDFILYNYKTKKIAIVEVKTNNKIISTWQRRLLEFVSSCIRNGKPSDYDYLGLYIIRFEKTNFNDGKVYLNGEESSEEQIRKILTF